MRYSPECIEYIENSEREITARDTAKCSHRNNMRAVILTETPQSRSAITEHLSVTEDMARPSVKSDEVLVKVKATALNIEDILNGVAERIGLMVRASAERPVVLGQEFSGVVEEVGSRVSQFRVGQAVLGHKVRNECNSPSHLSHLSRCRSE